MLDIIQKFSLYQISRTVQAVQSFFNEAQTFPF